MGYEIAFIPNEEQMSKFKPWNLEETKRTMDEEVSMIDMQVMSITQYCMQDHSDEISISVAKNILSQLRFLLATVKADVEHFNYIRWMEDENHEIYFCGWEVSKPLDCDRYDLNHAVNELFIYATMVGAPSYFDEQNKFFQKLEHIRDFLNDVVEDMRDYYNHTIVDYLRELHVEKHYDEE